MACAKAAQHCLKRSMIAAKILAKVRSLALRLTRPAGAGHAGGPGGTGAVKSRKKLSANNRCF